MSKRLRFAKYPEPRSCDFCGSLLGQLLEESEAGEGLGIVHERYCPSPYCAAEHERPDSIDASFLYRTRVLVFTATGDDLPQGEDTDDIEEVGVIRAVKRDEVHDPVSRRNAPIVVKGVYWPRDRKQFNEMFNRHVHHERAPNITKLNDGWDSSRPLPVL